MKIRQKYEISITSTSANWYHKAENLCTGNSTTILTVTIIISTSFHWFKPCNLKLDAVSQLWYSRHIHRAWKKTSRTLSVVTWRGDIQF